MNSPKLNIIWVYGIDLFPFIFRTHPESIENRANKDYLVFSDLNKHTIKL